MKKLQALALISVLCLGLLGCGEKAEDKAVEPPNEEVTVETQDESPAAESNETEEAPVEEDPDLKEILLKEAGASEADLQLFDMNDFNNDGAMEAFALIGGDPDYDYDEAGLVDGVLWFVNSEGAKKLVDKIGMGLKKEDILMDFGSRKYVVFYDVYATGVLTYAFEVDGKEVSETTFSARGTIVKDDDSDFFRIVDSSYDMIQDPAIDGLLGHSWKSYYFYFDRNTDSVKEYGGKEISREKATELAGRDIVAECLRTEDNLDSIIYRKNGIIHINYSSTEEDGCTYFHHRNWLIDKGIYIDDYNVESDEVQDGTYRTELCPEIAEYPED